MNEIEVQGELIATDDTDGLIEAYEQLDATIRQLFHSKNEIRMAIGLMALGDAKTQRVRGHRRVCVVERPDDRWIQSELKAIRQAYPQFAGEFLRVAELAVNKKEWKKAQQTSGPEDFEAFKRRFASANQGPCGLPRIVVEPTKQRTEQPNGQEFAEELSDDGSIF